MLRSQTFRIVISGSICVVPGIRPHMEDARCFVMPATVSDQGDLCVVTWVEELNLTLMIDLMTS